MSSLLKRFARKDRVKSTKPRGRRYGGVTGQYSYASANDGYANQSAELRRAMSSVVKAGKP